MHNSFCVCDYHLLSQVKPENRNVKSSVAGLENKEEPTSQEWQVSTPFAYIWLGKKPTLSEMTCLFICFRFFCRFPQHTPGEINKGYSVPSTTPYSCSLVFSRAWRKKKTQLPSSSTTDSPPRPKAHISSRWRLTAFPPSALTIVLSAGDIHLTTMLFTAHGRHRSCSYSPRSPGNL